MVEYQWTKNGEIRSSSSVLDFTPLTRSDDGLYTCTVTITSPLLNRTFSEMGEKTLTVIRKLIIMMICVQAMLYSSTGFAGSLPVFLAFPISRPVYLTN